MAIFALNSFRDVGKLISIGAVVFLFFLMLGVGISSYITFSTCDKIDTDESFVQSARWSLYPTIAYLVIRSCEFLRIYFDRFYRSIDTSDAGKIRAGWISVGYVMTLACVAGIFSLKDSSIEKICVPSVDEAMRFRQRFLEKKSKQEAMKEKTPALQQSEQQDKKQQLTQKP
jgi:hypothetical protein